MRGFRDPANDALVREQGLAALLFQLFGARAFPTALEEEERAFMLKSWDDREAAFGMLNWYRAAAIEVPSLDAPYEVPAGWTPPMLPKLTIPTLVIWAAEDQALPTGNIAGLDALVDDLTLVEIADSGHFVQWEKPGEVIAAMEEFLSRTSG